MGFRKVASRMKEWVNGMDTLLLQKEVDKSVLSQGLSIPHCYQQIFADGIGLKPAPSEKLPVKLILDGVKYDARIVNQNFSREKYDGHVDVLQIRYDSNRALREELRKRFSKTLGAVNAFYGNPENKGTQLKIPTGEKEYIVLYATGIAGEIFMDAVSAKEYAEEAQALAKLPEMDFELMTNQGATILIETGIRKVRKMSRAIGDALKKSYGYRCQICGQYIGEPYGSNLIHAHHIEPFTKSLNNNADNILIVCPNHHGIIHDRNPKFDPKKKTYTYPNGFVEGLKVNWHL